MGDEFMLASMDERPPVLGPDRPRVVAADRPRTSAPDRPQNQPQIGPGARIGPRVAFGSAHVDRPRVSPDLGSAQGRPRTSAMGWAADRSQARSGPGIGRKSAPGGPKAGPVSASDRSLGRPQIGPGPSAPGPRPPNRPQLRPWDRPLERAQIGPASAPASTARLYTRGMSNGLPTARPRSRTRAAPPPPLQVLDLQQREGRRRLVQGGLRADLPPQRVRRREAHLVGARRRHEARGARGGMLRLQGPIVLGRRGGTRTAMRLCPFAHRASVRRAATPGQAPLINLH